VKFAQNIIGLAIFAGKLQYKRVYQESFANKLCIGFREFELVKRWRREHLNDYLKQAGQADSSICGFQISRAATIPTM